MGLAGIERIFTRVLELARRQLGMDIAWVSESTEGQQALREVVGDTESFGVHAGWCGPYEDSYCSRVIANALPNLIPDARSDRRSKDLPVTGQLGIGSYIGVPVLLSDGEV